MMSMYYIYNKIKQAILITHYRPQLCRNYYYYYCYYYYYHHLGLRGDILVH